MTVSTEKAAPIPAEVAALAWRVVDTLWMSSHEKTDARRTIEREVTALLADREARPSLPDSREERIREDKRAEAREDLLFLTGERTAREYNEAINFAVDECDEPGLFLRVWREGGCEEYADEINEWADFRAYRARARQGGNNG